VKAAEWRNAIGELVRDHWRSAEVERYFSVKMNRRRAQIVIAQLGIYIRHRRNLWAHVSANCPVLAVKQKILQHEYGEVIKDQYAEGGHISLIIRQANAVGLTAEETLNAQPLATTRAVLYAWSWITRTKHWVEGLAAVTATEWTNDDRLLGDLGGGHSSRMAKRWMDDMGLKWKDMPNFEVHRQADEDHSDMFLPCLAEFATGEKEALALDAVRESLELYGLYREGIAKAMEKIPLA